MTPFKILFCHDYLLPSTRQWVLDSLFILIIQNEKSPLKLMVFTLFGYYSKMANFGGSLPGMFIPHSASFGRD